MTTSMIETMVMGVVGAVVIIGWFAALFFGLHHTFEGIGSSLGAWDLPRLALGVATLTLTLALPVAVMYEVSKDPPGLCLEGHQEWRRGSRGAPYKVWVCDVRERAPQ
jgi:Flp pilus assembly pilin Flp